ncbi:MAG: PAS domain-containing sensor histidine kinase [Gammaproteobacteria bacterium]
MEYSQALFEAIIDSAVLLDKTGRIVDWNQGATSLFGYPKKEVLGRSLNLIYQQNHPFPKIIQEVLPQQKKWIEETPFIRKNGIRGVCKTCVSLVHHSVGNKVAALITHQNVTSYKAIQADLEDTSDKLAHELKDRLEMFYLCNSLLVKNLASHDEIEKVLRESELRFHLLAENATDMISRHSPDGTYLYVSPSSRNLIGFLPDELVGRNAYKLLHYDDVNKLKKIFTRRKSAATHQTITYRIRHKEGDYRWFESNIRVITDEDTRDVREIQSASRDITDRVLDKKARLRGQQLAHVFRLSTMEEMASGMAHEISQPLAAIVNYTQGCVRYLQKEHHDPNQLIEIMNKAVAQAERAGEVIHRLKNFFCKGQLFRTPCKINSIIRETVSLIRNDLNTSKTKTDFDLTKDLPLISMDKIQFQQVILNLIQNAIEAMKENQPQDRRIHIHTKQVDKNTVEVTVSDTGPGFSKEIITKVFKPFFTTKAHGRGMGLAICRSIIEAHGGQFTINPNSTGHSWIKFTLPIY